MDWYSRDHDVRLRFPHKTMFSSSLPPVVRAEWCPTHNMLCCFVWFVFVLCLVYPILSVSLVCPLLIAPSVFSNVYLFGLSSSSVLCTQCCQFLWFVHSCLPLRIVLTFRISRCILLKNIM